MESESFYYVHFSFQFFVYKGLMNVSKKMTFELKGTIFNQTFVTLWVCKMCIVIAFFLFSYFFCGCVFGFSTMVDVSDDLLMMALFHFFFYFDIRN